MLLVAKAIQTLFRSALNITEYMRRAINKCRASLWACESLSTDHSRARGCDADWQQQQQAVWSSGPPGPRPANKSYSVKITRLKMLGACLLPVSFHCLSHAGSSGTADPSLPHQSPRHRELRGPRPCGCCASGSLK